MPWFLSFAGEYVPASFPVGAVAASRPLSPLQVALSVAGLVIAVAIGFWLYQHWLEANEADEPVTDEDVLAEFDRAYISGEMSKEEYQRVTALLKRPGETARGGARPNAPKPKPDGEAPPAPPAEAPPPAAES